MRQTRFPLVRATEPRLREMHHSPEVTALVSRAASEGPTRDHPTPKPLTPTLATPTVLFRGHVWRTSVLSLPPHRIARGPENRAELPLPITGEARPRGRGRMALGAGEGLPRAASPPGHPGGRMQTLLSSALPTL